MTTPKLATQYPEAAPKGFYFYLATTPCSTEKGRRYLHSIHRPEKPFGDVSLTLSPTRSMAKPFDRLTVARAYADFLNRMDGVARFYIVIEAGRVLDHPSARKVAPYDELKSSLKRYSAFRWE